MNSHILNYYPNYDAGIDGGGFSVLIKAMNTDHALAAASNTYAVANAAPGGYYCYARDIKHLKRHEYLVRFRYAYDN